MAAKPVKAKAASPKGEPDPQFAPIAAAFAKKPGVTAGMLMASYGLKVNGKIFAMFSRGAFVAKLPKQRVDSLIASGAGVRFDPGHGRIMKEWISIGPGAADLMELAQEAYRFVASAR